eukprot:TRINITY_DN3485_c0_g1_i2.p1 TRINITY_DN3485_c0_g1~~TRINITY_DN3485_c0_g1_i2.p1  ORF type:complete len:127 (+),score=5.53 TRINITY_DN3485_c0_g1_i2:21-401(+)
MADVNQMPMTTLSPNDTEYHLHRVMIPVMGILFGLFFTLVVLAKVFNQNIPLKSLCLGISGLQIFLTVFLWFNYLWFYNPMFLFFAAFTIYSILRNDDQSLFWSIILSIFCGLFLSGHLIQLIPTR